MEEKAFEETKIPVMLLKNKAKDEHFLASGVDFIDEGDPDGDVTLKYVENAFAIVRNDFQAPTNEDLERVKAMSVEHKKNMIAKFGEHAVVFYDVEKWLQSYKPINVEITLEQYNKLAKNNDWETL